MRRVAFQDRRRHVGLRWFVAPRACSIAFRPRRRTRWRRAVALMCGSSCALERPREFVQRVVERRAVERVPVAGHRTVRDAAHREADAASDRRRPPPRRPRSRRGGSRTPGSRGRHRPWRSGKRTDSSSSSPRARGRQHAGEEVVGRDRVALLRATQRRRPRVARAGTAAARPTDRHARSSRRRCRDCGSGNARCAGTRAAAAAPRARASGRHSTAACVAAAPMRRPPSVDVDRRPVVLLREMSISSCGCASRMFSTAISDWPPASMRASSPCSASSGRRLVGGVGAHVVERQPASRSAPEQRATSRASERPPTRRAACGFAGVPGDRATRRAAQR